MEQVNVAGVSLKSLDPKLGTDSDKDSTGKTSSRKLLEGNISYSLS